MNIIEQSNRIFGSGLQLIDDNLYKAKYSIKNKTAGIYYINFSNVVTEDYFEELQHKHIAEEFYNQEDSLQWNIYLLFVNNNMSEELKMKILKDDKYARKLIFTESEYLDYFNLEDSINTELPDIVSKWKNELNEVGLQDLYTDATYERIINNLIENKETIDITRKDKDLSYIPIIEKVNSIHLNDNYRPFPKIRDFNFGSVNLITGSNGVGKTSLLESIELILTGKTQRNYNIEEEENSIVAKFNDSINDSYIHNNKYYKERGIKWYNRRSSESGNQTFKSFNRFNFFNTDAANQFSNSEEKDIINESLKQIILGEEYTNLKDRIQKIHTRIKSELNKSSNSIREKNERLKENTNRIEVLKNEKSFDQLKSNIKLNIENLKYKKEVAESLYSIPNLFINEIKNELEFLSSNKWLNNYNDFLNKKSIVESRIELIEKNKILYNQNFKKSNDLSLINENLESTLKTINRFLRYIQIDNNLMIENLDKNIKSIDLSLAKINDFKNLSNLGLDILKFKSNYLSDVIDLNESLLNKERKDLVELNNEIEVLKSSFNLSEKLYNEIKQLGKSILIHNEDTKHCPLCEQDINESDLFKKLENEFVNDEIKNLIDQKTKKVEIIKEKISRIEIEINSIKIFESVLNKYLTKSSTIKEIDNYINEVINSESTFLIEKQKCDIIYDQLLSFNGSLTEYQKLKAEIILLYPNLEITNKNILDNIILDTELEIIKNKEIIEEVQKSNSEIINVLNSTLKLKEYFNDIESLEENYKSKKNIISSIEFSFANLSRYIDISGDADTVHISKELSLLNENLMSLKLLEDNQNEIKILIIKNNKIETELPILKGINERLHRANEKLMLLNNNSEDKILDDFFQSNLKEIKDIFTTIHSPKEFRDIQYIDNRLVLFKNNEDKFYEISQISTGQRGALVLSIFISLNRKLKNGPNILIFDDPVTFIDDFNALSFLDFLRYFIVKENKQIFFATANNKFTSLFKKKFKFLGDSEFKHFELER